MSQRRKYAKNNAPRLRHAQPVVVVVATRNEKRTAEILSDITRMEGKGYFTNSSAKITAPNQIYYNIDKLYDIINI